MNPHTTRSAWLPDPRYWLLPAVVCLLRGLPGLWTRLASPRAGEAWLPVGYMPPDLISYAAFIHQAAERGTLLLYDPYTTEPHRPRFILLLHWALGWFSRASGLSAELVLELSRLPLIFAFFGVLWWFVSPLLPDRKERYWACLLVGLSGGLEGFLTPLRPWLSQDLQQRLDAGIWHLYGWNTFQALYNPLWIAGLTLSMLVLRPALDPQGPRSFAAGLRIAAGWLVLFYVHPYSALAVLAILAALPLAEWTLGGACDARRLIRLATAFLPALAVVAAVSHWQTRDPVYRAAAGNVLGPLGLPVFWYPLTLGAVGLLALRGARTWIATSHPWRFSLAAWIAAVALLHTSPVFNGYHFVCYLHLPLCILAAPAVRDLVERLARIGPSGTAPSGTARSGTARSGTGWTARLATLCALILVFASCGFVTMASLADVQHHNRVPADYDAVVASLADRAPGNALAPPSLGNIIPARTGHRVWVGHWFLTPDYARRSARYETLVGDPGQTSELLELLREQQIRYLVLPRSCGVRLGRVLHPYLEGRVVCGDLEVFVLRDTREAGLELVDWDEWEVSGGKPGERGLVRVD